MAGTASSAAKIACASASRGECSRYDYIWLLYSGQTLAGIRAQMRIGQETTVRWNRHIRRLAATDPDGMAIEHSGITWADALRLAMRAAQHERDVQLALHGSAVTRR